MLTPREARGLASSDLFGPVEVPCPSADDIELPLPERIGPFRVLRRVASGGMGTVYEAEQEKPRRRVAVKVLRPGVVSRETLRRFQAEVEILGKLQHPGIAQIFDAGTYDDGGGAVPWFAMEFIDDGLPITDFADQQKLDRLQRLNLFLQVCDAVQHGHVRGVIHRDLKPENILVTCPDDTNAKGASAIARVIDFGVARSIGDGNPVTTMLTRGGQVLGTLPYMSPEQCDGNGDTRTDVYALGVLLYRLLTGRLPFDLTGKSTATAIRTIQETTPDSPRNIDRTLGGGLESIMLKALEKDPSRRYQSVGELAGDVRAWMSGEPVTARPPGAWMKFGRVVRRHPLVTTSIAAVLIGGSIIGSSFVTAWWLSNSPSRIVFSNDRTTAYLVSRGGATLRTFGGREGGKVSTAELFKYSGTQYVLLCVDGLGQNSTNGQLHLYDTSNLDTPLWATEPNAPYIEIPALPDRFDNEPENHNVFNALLADVFPSVDGPEIVAIHGHSSSRWCLRVYDLRGQVVFEAWHFGMMKSTYWMESSSQLVIAADRHDRTEIAGYGWPDANGRVWPKVLFAITPVLGSNLGWINWPETDSSHKTTNWYKVFLPRVILDQTRLELIPPTRPSDDPRSTVEVTFWTNDFGPFTTTVNQNGDVIEVHAGDETDERIGDSLIPALHDWPPDPSIVDTPVQDQE